MPARSTALSASLAWSCGTLRAASAKWPVQLKTTVPWVLHPKCQVDDLWCSPTLFGAGGQDAQRHAADVLGRQPLAMVAFRHLTRAGAAPNADYERQATRCEVLRTDHSALDQRPGFYVRRWTGVTGSGFRADNVPAGAAVGFQEVVAFSAAGSGAREPPSCVACQARPYARGARQGEVLPC